MPSEALKSMAEKMGLSVAQAEEAWEKGKDAAKESHPEFKEGSDRYYEYVMGTTRKIMQNMKKSKSSAIARVIALGPDMGLGHGLNDGPANPTQPNNMHGGLPTQPRAAEGKKVVVEEIDGGYSCVSYANKRMVETHTVSSPEMLGPLIADMLRL